MLLRYRAATCSKVPNVATVPRHLTLATDCVQRASSEGEGNTLVVSDYLAVATRYVNLTELHSDMFSQRVLLLLDELDYFMNTIIVSRYHKHLGLFKRYLIHAIKNKLNGNNPILIILF